METVVERHQVVFVNPDLAGLYTAYLAHRAGAKIAIIDEGLKADTGSGKYPHAFPAAGTFHPRDIDNMAMESGFPPPIWERIPRLTLLATDRKVILNSDDGPGGLLLSMEGVFRRGKRMWARWFQKHLEKTEELLANEDQRRMGTFKVVRTSVADSILKLELSEPDPLLVFFDILSILVVGRGIVQLDVRDFPLVLAGFLTGWHVPAPGEKNWGDILKRRLQKEGARCLDVESVADIGGTGKRSSIVRLGDGTCLSGKIIVVPQSDRYRHPAVQDLPGSIMWKSWYGRVDNCAEDSPLVGLLRLSDKRPPINDNFIAFHLRGELNGLVTVAAPVEERYIHSRDPERIESITTLVKYILSKRLGWKLESLSTERGKSIESVITLPGTSPTVSYPEGPLWGDDAYTRLKAADRLSRRIVERLK